MKKRTIALILAVLMLVSVTPLAVFGEKVAPELETDAEGYLLVNEFDELYKHLDANRGQSFKTLKYRLNKDISEWSNAKTLPVGGITAEIDLNGHTLDIRTYWGYTNLISVYDRGHLTIKDTSEAKTGVVTYNSDYAKHVEDEDIDDDDGSICAIYCNRDSTVEIYGGTYRLSSYGQIFWVDGGTLKIYDGVFENTSDKLYVGAVMLYRRSTDRPVPTAMIYGGTFRLNATPILIERSMGKTSGFGKASGEYPVVGVFGGEFFADSYWGLAYAHEYGEVIVYGGLIPKSESKNGDDWSLAKNATAAEETVDGKAYLRVSPPEYFVTDDLTLNDRFTDALARYYLSNLSKDSTIYKNNSALIDSYLAAPQTMTVGERDLDALELTVSGQRAGSKLVRLYALYAEDHLRYPWIGNSPWHLVKEIVSPASTVTFTFDRPNEAGVRYFRLYVDRGDGTVVNDIIKVIYREPAPLLTGTAFPTQNSVRYGNTLFCGLKDLSSGVPVDSLRFEWRVDGVKVGTERTIKLDKAEWVGKKLTVVVTSTVFGGAIVSAPVEIAKGVNHGTPEMPNVSVTLTGDAFEKIDVAHVYSDQEYLISKKAASALTDEDWAKAESGLEVYFAMDNDSLSSQYGITAATGDTLYVYTRFAGTDAMEAGTEVRSACVKVGATVYLQSITFPDAVNNIIYIPYTGTDETFDIAYELSPVNATTGYDITWRSSSSSLTIVSPTSPEPVAAASGKITLKTTGVGGGGSIEAYYTTLGETVYGKVSVIVYDPANVTAGSLRLAKPFDNVTVYAGTGFRCEDPEFIVAPTVDVDIKWHFTRGTMYGWEQVDDVGFAAIDPDTGEIETSAPGKVTVSMFIENNLFASYQLTVIEKPEGFVGLEAIYPESSEMKLAAGEKRTIKIIKAPADATEDKFLFTSSAPGVASVDENGVVSALQKGEATITVTDVAGKVSTTVKVTVTDSAIPGGVTPGDVDGNGKINGKDVIALMKHIVGSTPQSFIEAAADFNGDGKTNGKDVIALMKYIVANP